MSVFGHEPRRHAKPSEVENSRVRLRVLFILGALPAAAVALLVPAAIAMPTASLVSMLLAACVATYAYRARVNYHAKGLTFWDLAGMLAFIGISAGAMSEPAAALELFGMTATK